MRKLMVSGGEQTVPTAALSQASLEGQKRDITPSELSEVVLLRLSETDLADQSMAPGGRNRNPFHRLP
jgi:hypothetical protein